MGWWLYFTAGLGFLTAMPDDFDNKGCLLQGVIFLFAFLFWPAGLTYYVTRYLIKELAK